MRSSSFLCPILLTLTIACSMAAAPDKGDRTSSDGETPAAPDRASQLVYSVEKVVVRIPEGQPNKLVIEASGSASSGGWTAADLRVRPIQTRDGTLTLEFVAKPPEGMAIQSITPIKATATVNKPGLFRQVKVVAKTNAAIGK